MDASLHLVAHDRRMVELERDLARQRDRLPTPARAARPRPVAPDRAERHRPRLVSQARALLRLA